MGKKRRKKGAGGWRWSFSFEHPSFFTRTTNVVWCCSRTHPHHKLPPLGLFTIGCAGNSFHWFVFFTSQISLFRRQQSPTSTVSCFSSTLLQKNPFSTSTPENRKIFEKKASKNRREYSNSSVFNKEFLELFFIFFIHTLGFVSIVNGREGLWGISGISESDCPS